MNTVSVNPGSAFAVFAALMRQPSDAESAPQAEAQDLRAAVGGDGEAFARLIGLHQQRVAAHVWPLLRDAGAVEEVVQDTFVEAYLALASFRGGSKFSTWLCGIATRLVYRRLRDRDRRGRRDGTFAREQSAVAADARESDERDARLWSIVDSLSPMDRLVVTLAYVHNLSIAEIATLAGSTSVVVKVRLHRARIKIRKAYERETHS
ncbi:MAG: RNA polymerase sigma factor [Phycisphaerales bacterium]